ncbi:MAG: hypothetical protein WC050_01655 [Candidatus Paceibacterota bacterium]
MINSDTSQSNVVRLPVTYRRSGRRIPYSESIVGHDYLGRDDEDTPAPALPHDLHEK